MEIKAAVCRATHVPVGIESIEMFGRHVIPELHKQKRR